MVPLGITVICLKGWAKLDALAGLEILFQAFLFQPHGNTRSGDKLKLKQLQRTFSPPSWFSSLRTFLTLEQRIWVDSILQTQGLLELKELKAVDVGFWRRLRSTQRGPFLPTQVSHMLVLLPSSLSGFSSPRVLFFTCYKDKFREHIKLPFSPKPFSALELGFWDPVWKRSPL